MAWWSHSHPVVWRFLNAMGTHPARSIGKACSAAPCRAEALPLCLPRQFLPAAMPLLKFLPEDTKIDFVGARYYAFALDGLLLLAAIFSIAVHGFNLGIDFTGGVLLEVKSAHVID